MMEKMWSKVKIPSLLVGVQIYTATLEINMAIFQKTENQST